MSQPPTPPKAKRPKMNKKTPTHPKTMPLKRLVKKGPTDKVVSGHTLTMSLTPVTLLLCDLTSSSFFFSFDFPRTFSRLSLSSSMSDSVSGSSSSSSNCSVFRSGHYKYFPLLSDFSQLIKGALSLSRSSSPRKRTTTFAGRHGRE